MALDARQRAKVALLLLAPALVAVSLWLRYVQGLRPAVESQYSIFAVDRSSARLPETFSQEAHPKSV